VGGRGGRLDRPLTRGARRSSKIRLTGGGKKKRGKTEGKVVKTPRTRIQFQNEERKGLTKQLTAVLSYKKKWSKMEEKRAPRNQRVSSDGVGGRHGGGGKKVFCERGGAIFDWWRLKK